MIRTHDLVLILDTNILPKIISSQDPPRIDQIFSRWVKALCVGINPPPKGKVVTIAVSTEMINDYKTGLRRCRHSKVAKTLKIIFDKSLSDVVETGSSGSVRLMLEKVTPKRSASSMRVRDPYDQGFLDDVFHVKARGGRIGKFCLPLKIRSLSKMQSVRWRLGTASAFT